MSNRYIKLAKIAEKITNFAKLHELIILMEFNGSKRKTTIYNKYESHVIETLYLVNLFEEIERVGLTMKYNALKIEKEIDERLSNLDIKDLPDNLFSIKK